MVAVWWVGAVERGSKIHALQTLRESSVLGLVVGLRAKVGVLTWRRLSGQGEQVEAVRRGFWFGVLVLGGRLGLGVSDQRHDSGLRSGLPGLEQGVLQLEGLGRRQQDDFVEFCHSHLSFNCPKLKRRGSEPLLRQLPDGS